MKFDLEIIRNNFLKITGIYMYFLGEIDIIILMLHVHVHVVLLDRFIFK